MQLSIKPLLSPSRPLFWFGNMYLGTCRRADWSPTITLFARTSSVVGVKEQDVAGLLLFLVLDRAELVDPGPVVGGVAAETDVEQFEKPEV